MLGRAPNRRLSQRRSLAKEIADQLIGEIKAGRLRPGKRLPTERVLMERFGVGRSTIREALQHLVILGVADAKPGFGYSIKEFDAHAFLDLNLMALLLARDTLLDLLEAREIVEVPIARLAAARATEEDTQAMERLLQQMELRLARGQTVHRQAARFHLLLAKAAKNATLERWISGIIPLLTARGLQIEQNIEGRSKAEIALHRRLYECIKSHDASVAEEAMIEHLADARSTILSASGSAAPEKVRRNRERPKPTVQEMRSLREN